MKFLRQIGVAVLVALVVVVLGPVVAVAGLPVLVVTEIGASVRLMRFRRKEAGCCYLICTSRRGWHDFLKNNVAPYLPGNVRVVWHRPGMPKDEDPIFAHVRRSKYFNITKPYLVCVTRRRLIVRTVNDRLLHLKPMAWVCEEARKASAAILAATMTELRS